MNDALEKFQEAKRQFVISVAHALKIDKLCDWLTKTIRKFNP